MYTQEDIDYAIRILENSGYSTIGLFNISDVDEQMEDAEIDKTKLITEEKMDILNSAITMNIRTINESIFYLVTSVVKSHGNED